MKPNRYQAIRMLTLLVFVLAFEGISFTGAHAFRSPDWTPLLFVAYVFASSLVGRALAYLTIFKFVRHWFTVVVPHSSGVGEDVHPRASIPDDRAWKIVREVIGTWLSCPICAGTWGALGLALMYTVDPAGGKFIIYVLGAAGAGSILTRSAETIEWAGHYLHEMTGHWNRANVIENENDTLTTVQQIQVFTEGGGDPDDHYHYEEEPTH